jgi:glycosidase
MQLTLRGVPFIYYGEEIGMSNVKFKLKTSEDPIGRKFSWFPMPQLSRLIGFSLTRDRCRTPMQWNDNKNAGFSSNIEIEPWLKVSDTFEKINVEKEQKNPASLLNCYKRLLKVRKENIALQEGKLQLIEHKKSEKNYISYTRSHKAQKIFIYLNFSKKELLIQTPIEKPELLFSTLSNRKALDTKKYNGNIKLTPLEGIIFKKK